MWPRQRDGEFKIAESVATSSRSSMRSSRALRVRSRFRARAASLLPDVLERRTGIPITLTLVWCDWYRGNARSRGRARRSRDSRPPRRSMRKRSAAPVECAKAPDAFSRLLTPRRDPSDGAAEVVPRVVLRPVQVVPRGGTTKEKPPERCAFRGLCCRRDWCRTNDPYRVKRHGRLEG